jgi:cellulose synthase (UDP-forming)
MSERVGVWCLRFLVGLGIASLAFYFSWWVGHGRISSPVLAAGLALAAAYHCFQMLGAWFFYLMARRRPEPPPPPGLTVDVFVTACGEEVELVRRALGAAIALRGEHRTWLLDDGPDPRLAHLARELGTGYLTRPDRRDAKAGNLNAALRRTSSDVIAIFDVDHVPTPEYLERTLGYFADPRIGFVQVMLTYGNANQSWVARAAIESSLDFHNPTSMGMDGLDTVTMHGSNSLVRRAALESIGGYKPGLAEDLATSVALHAAGWRSAFVPEPLAPGLVPVDIGGWFTQQLKWARGVFETLLTEYPALFRSLTWAQRLAYAVRATYYWVGALVFVHLLFLVAALLFGQRMVRASFEEYLVHYAPLAISFFLIRGLARRLWRHPSTPTRLEWRGILLVYATWPIYTLAWVMALVRAPLRFRMTPKHGQGEPSQLWLLPQLFFVVLLAASVLHALSARGADELLLISSAVVQLVMLCGFVAFSGLVRRPHRASGSAALLQPEQRP